MNDRHHLNPNSYGIGVTFTTRAGILRRKDSIYRPRKAITYWQVAVADTDDRTDTWPHFWAAYNDPRCGYCAADQYHSEHLHTTTLKGITA